MIFAKVGNSYQFSSFASEEKTPFNTTLAICVAFF